MGAYARRVESSGRAQFHKKPSSLFLNSHLSNHFPSMIPRGGGMAERNTVNLHGSKNKEHNYEKSLLAAGGGSTSEQPIPNTWGVPIDVSEFPQFLCMSVMMFLFIYIFTTVRDTKDSLVVSNCGAEAIPFLKLYGVMPAAFLFILGYSKLSNILGKKALFYATLSPFITFYTIFAFVLFPKRDLIHLTPATGDGVANAAVNLIRYWSFSLYFIISELWGSVSIPLLFWQFANEVTPMGQAKRFYPLFAVLGNLAPVVSGKVMTYIVSRQKTTDDIGFGSTLKKLGVIKLAVSFVIVVLYNAVNMMVDKSKEQTDLVKAVETFKKSKKVQVELKFSSGKNTKKKKPTLGESMKELSKSKELKAMATMVLCYNICIELTEVLWKGILRKQLPSKTEYMAYMAGFSQKVGTIAFFLQLGATFIIRVLGWKNAALITPLTMGVLAIPFFVSVAIGEPNVLLTTAMLIGTWQNVASKVTKYSLFDPCKEMAYIPLGPEAKVKGKAAVDVLGARLGRSLGSASQQLLVILIGKGSILNCAPYLLGLYATAITFWINAVSVLGTLFKTTKDDDNESKKDTVQVSVRKFGKKGKISAKFE